MFALSLSTFRERWQLFIGAILTVAMGVALVQSSLLILISAAAPVIPPGPDAAQLRDGYTAAITLLAMTLFIASFLAIFIVSSTFAFTVAQRRRDLALLRLVGGARRQLRRLLLSEALLLGMIGTALGIPLGLAVMRVQTGLLTDLGFIPAEFLPRWQDWILGVSFGIGIGVALLGVLAASRRAAKVRPLEALRDTGAAVKVMTFSRWFFGLLFLAGSLALMIVAQFAGPDGAIPMSINVALTAAVALSALSPLVVPLVGRLFGLVMRRSTLGGLAQANLRDGVRRSASAAAPLLILVALVLGLSGSLSTISEAGRVEQARDIVGDLVVNAPVAQIPGVAVASEEITVPMTVTTTEEDDDKIKSKTKDEQALAVDPATYQQTHRRAPSLDGLHGMTIAVGSGEDLVVGDTVSARIGDRDLTLRVVALLPESMSGGPSFLLPKELAPPTASVQTIVHTAADPAAVAASIRATGAKVMTIDEWIAANAAKQDTVSSGIMTVLMGLAGLYTLVAVINAVVIAAAERRAEFAAARATGLNRSQVVGMALIEAWAVAAIGLVLGCVAAAGTLAGIGSAVGHITGTAVYSIPWLPLALVTIGSFVVIGVTSVWTTLSATRTPRPTGGSRSATPAPSTAVW